MHDRSRVREDIKGSKVDVTGEAKDKNMRVDRKQRNDTHTSILRMAVTKRERMAHSK
jgi:hypothetical protein